MESEIFGRTRALLGEERFGRLQEASVMVVGLGAVGGYALEALARAGIGHLILVDFDIVEPSNLNRQILALHSTLGRKKGELAAERVRDINPDCRITIKDMFINRDNLEQLFDQPVDMVVDAIDSLNPKCCLIEYLQQHEIPFISSMGAALKTDPSAIRLQTLNQTKNCPLARFIRKRLKRRGCDLGKVVCVCSDEVVSVPETALFMEDKPSDGGRQRHTMGSLPTVTAIFGLMMANQVILRLSGYK